MSTPTTPGRRRDLKHQPIFLRKTYHMISNCPPSIASWSEMGDSFVVKNTQDFAAKVIPCFFKHSNFSSFVRQLNFYGFRKVKAESILNTGNETKSWEFKHDKFIRGQPGLLSEIRRASGYAANSEPSIPQEVDELKAEVASLRSQVELLTHTARDLTLLVNTFVRERNTAASGLPIDPLHELPMPSFEGGVCDNGDKRSYSPSSDSTDHQGSEGSFSLTGRTSNGNTSCSASSSVAGGRGHRRLRSPRNPRPLAGAYASSASTAVAANGRQTGVRANVKLSLQKGGGGRRSAAASRSSSASASPSGASFLTDHSQAQQMYHDRHDPFNNGGSSSLTEGEDDDEEDEDEDEEFTLMQGVAAVAHAGNDLGGTMAAATSVQQQQQQQHARGVEMELSIGNGGAGDGTDGNLDDNQDFAESLRAFFPIDDDPGAEETARGFHSMLLKNFMDDPREGNAQGHGPGEGGLVHAVGNTAGAAWGDASVSLEDNVPMEVKMGAIFDTTPAAPPPSVVAPADLYSSDPPSGAGLVGANGAYLLPAYAAPLPAMQPPPHLHLNMASVDAGAMMGGSVVTLPARRKRKLTHEENQEAMPGEAQTEDEC